MKKGGHGKGNWGDDKKPVEGQEPEGEVEETKQPPRERRERRERKEEPKEAVQEKVESEEEEGFTLQDYLNQKAASGTTQLTAAQTREHEKFSAKGL